jgi:phosphoglycolate phosphatase
MDLYAMKKLFLFDFDGVIADSLELFAGLAKKSLESMGKPIIQKTEDFLELFEDNYFENLSRKGIDLTEFFNHSAGIFAQADYGSVSPMPGLLPVLEELCRRRHILIVISSNSSDAIFSMLSRFRFDGCFREILGADFKLSKKDKIEHALASYGVDKEHTYYVGDTTGDIKEARAAGVKAVGVTWGWHSRDKMAASSPDYLVDTPEMLLEI